MRKSRSVVGVVIVVAINILVLAIITTHHIFPSVAAWSVTTSTTTTTTTTTTLLSHRKQQQHQRRYPTHYKNQRISSYNGILLDKHHRFHQRLSSSLQSTLLYSTMKVDPYRDTNNIRPSLHPITINILVQVLKLRASSMIENKNNSNSNSSSNITVDVFTNNSSTTSGTSNSSIPVAANRSTIWSDQPIDIVWIVTQIASKAMTQHNKRTTVTTSTTATTNSSNSSTTTTTTTAIDDDMMILSTEEQQTILGRVIGAMVRLEQLQDVLVQQCSNISWIQRYNEWHTFGISSIEETVIQNKSSSSSSSSCTFVESSNKIDDRTVQQLQALLDDPLLLLNRAECLLALFIHTIEIPELQMKNCTVPDQSSIDFLDSDRRAVLLLLR